MIRVKRLFITTTVVASCLMAGAGSAFAAPGIAGLPLPEPLARLLAPPVPVEKKLSKGFGGLQKSMRKTMPGQIGIAVVPVGSDKAISLGPLKTGRAWSTLKVPVSLAAQRQNGTAVAAMENKAITFSDNDAAGKLWGSLGGGVASVKAVTGILREGHDLRTRVSSEADAPPSYPGYTQWALVDQARFGAHLPCMAGSEQIIRLMSSVAPNQQWGVAKVGRSAGAVSAVKGGWGPATSNSPGYLVRQLGIISTTRGQFAVSLAAVPKSGKFSDGTKMLNRMGAWLGKYLAELPAGRC